jgi:hypothetical protein
MQALEIDNVIQLYLLANNASTRLTTEAHRHDLRLRHLVLHANMLDRLTTEIDQRESSVISSSSSSSDDEHHTPKPRSASKQRKKKINAAVGSVFGGQVASS